MWEYDGSEGFRSIDGQLDDPSYSAANRDIIDSDYKALGREPEVQEPGSGPDIRSAKEKAPVLTTSPGKYLGDLD